MKRARTRVVRTGAVLAALVLLTGCAERKWNAAVETPTPARPGGDATGGGASGAGAPYDFENRLPRGNSRELFVVLAFSGGGVRASAFSYGILEALRDTRITIDGKERRLLDEVDLIASVSGGSYTAAYYGLFGDRIFRDFERKFLKRDLQKVLLRMYLSPAHVGSWFNRRLNRGDLVARWFGNNIYENKTFRDMSRGNLPFVMINASDLNTGLTFSFIQQQFDFLCSSILDYPVANAVTASSALPIAMAPITLRNHPRKCPERRQDWVRRALAQRNFKSREYQVARALVRYQNPATLPVIRLMDGGITDNLAVRGSVLSPIAHYGNVAAMEGAFNKMSAGKLKRVLVIVVNAQVYHPQRWSVRGHNPNILQQLQASFDAAIDILNTEAATLASLEYRRWARRLNKMKKPGQTKMKVFFSLVTFDQIRNPAERRRFNAVKTGAALPPDQVDAVRALAGRLLYAQPKFQAFLKAFRGRRVGQPIGGAVGQPVGKKGNKPR